MEFDFKVDVFGMTIVKGDGTPERRDFAWMDVNVGATKADETGAWPSIKMRVPVLYSNLFTMEDFEKLAIDKAKAMIKEASDAF